MKMKIKIWSDVMCPFCYIGKRRLEEALKITKNEANAEIEWKSFQLNPQLRNDASKNVHQYLSEIKGWSLAQAMEMNGRVSDMAKEAGLEYNFDKAVVANSFDAHRLVQLAKEHGKGGEAEELLFRSYFTDGKNIADHEVLTEIGKMCGLEEDEVRTMLKGEGFGKEVAADVSEARSIGVNGVPFFVFDDKFAVSGAQNVNVFVSAIEKVMEE
jgi:predicted DsbA family dithiol-disulfide isomerase